MSKLFKGIAVVVLAIVVIISAGCKSIAVTEQELLNAAYDVVEILPERELPDNYTIEIVGKYNRDGEIYTMCAIVDENDNICERFDFSYRLFCEMYGEE